jgi:hypothetical protein
MSHFHTNNDFQIGYLLSPMNLEYWSSKTVVKPFQEGAANDGFKTEQRKLNFLVVSQGFRN